MKIMKQIAFKLLYSPLFFVRTLQYRLLKFIVLYLSRLQIKINYITVWDVEWSASQVIM